jgi:dipeptidase
MLLCKTQLFQMLLCKTQLFQIYTNINRRPNRSQSRGPITVNDETTWWRFHRNVKTLSVARSNHSRRRDHVVTFPSQCEDALSCAVQSQPTTRPRGGVSIAT